MYRLLIVDDEPDIVEGLYMMLQNASQLELDIYRAYSGFEALEWLNRTKFDIVLSDIRMPGMSGIQMLEIIKERWRQCKIIFLTGYTEFDYAHQAIQHEVIGYVLKTEGYVEIVRAIEKAIDKIEQEQEMNDLIQRATKEMSEVLPLMQRDYLSDLLQGESSSSEQRKQRFLELDIMLNPDQPVFLVLGRRGQLLKSQSFLEKTQMFYSIKYLADQHFSPTLIRTHFLFDHSVVIWFIQLCDVTDGESGQQANTDVRKRIPYYIKGIVETIQEQCIESLQISFSFVIDHEPTAWEDVSSKHDSLKMWLFSQTGLGTDIYMTNGLTSGQEADLEKKMTSQRVQMRLNKLAELETCLESGHSEGFHELLNIITGNFEHYRGEHLNHKMEIFYSISLMFITLLNRWNQYDKMAQQFNLSKLMAMDKHLSWDDTVQYFQNLADAIFHLRNTEGEIRNVAAINQIKQYIHQHLLEDLSLVRLAEMVYFNPSYLSRLFKQITGTKLLTYINGAKLGKVKELLKNPELKIHEIASAVGYDSPAYFTQFFKKATQTSPQEYRESILKQVKKY